MGGAFSAHRKNSVRAILLYGGEAYHDDGPWVHPDDYSKFNGLLTYSQGDDANGFSITGRGYHGKWNSSDQLAENAVPLVGFFGTLNPTDGGNSERYSLQGEWHRQGADSETKIMAYGFYYDLDLFSDFTYYLTDTSRGDQFEQQDRRWVAGLDARHTIFSQWFGRDVENSLRPASPQRLDQQRSLPDGRSRARGQNRFLHRQYFARHNRKRIVLRTRKPVFMWKTKSSGRTNSARLLAMRGDLDYFDVTSLVTSGQLRHIQHVAAQPENEFDFRPVGKDGILCARRIQFSQQRRARRNTNRGAGFGGQSLSQHARHARSRPDPNQRRRKSACALRPCRICKAPFRFGICTAIPNCSRMATPAARLLPSSRATATASNGRTTTRP